VTIQAAVAFFRQAERQLMDSTVTVVRDDGEPTFDPDTGAYNQPTTTIYTGDALVRASNWEGSDTEAGETEVRLRTARIKFPADTPVLRDDRVTVDASADTRMVGRTFRVTDVLVDDWQISGTTFVEEVA
jgi:hypothetical protein